MEYLYWKPVLKEMKEYAKNKLPELKPSKDSFLAILFFWENISSQVYVNMKKKYGQDIWLDVKIFGQEILEDWTKKQRESKDILDLIEMLNINQECLWIIVQLPIPEYLRPAQAKILSKIVWHKDVDWLWWVVNWLSAIDLIDFIPATPKAIIKLLEYYNLWDFKWKTVSILWQSNLVWKPLWIEIMKKWWTVFSFNHHSNQKTMREICKNSDYILSCTWAIHLVNDSFLNSEWNQVIVDAWYWHKDGKAVWDVDFESVKEKVRYIAPVPWWVWPLTVSCLFDNLIDLSDIGYD